MELIFQIEVASFLIGIISFKSSKMHILLYINIFINYTNLNQPQQKKIHLIFKVELNQLEFYMYILAQSPMDF